MAEGGFDPTWTRRPKIQQLCRYFIHGACHKGDDCRFVHDRTGSVPSNNVCKFYQQGRCSYGDSCRYDHIKASRADHHYQEGILQNRQNGSRQHKSSESTSTQHDDSIRQTTRTRNNSDDTWDSSFVTLRKGNSNSHDNRRENAATNKKQPPAEGYRSRVFKNNWAKAKDFVPGQKFHAGASYATKAQDSDAQDDPNNDPITKDDHQGQEEPKEEDLMCPYYGHGHCPYGEDCHYVHGDVCDVCQMPRLHPTDTAQREEHSKECLKEMEKDMEHSFAIQDSQKKECCICLEIVVDKADKEPEGACKKTSSSRSNQFGILENCTHCFCLDCIRRWRSDKMSFGKNVRVCPICRVHSDFVTPSNVWVEEEEAKKKVIQDYKDALRLKPCQYFKQGKGNCPFNEKCFYKHAYPDGTIAEPKPRPKKRRQMNSNGELSTMESMTLWDFLEVREDGLISLEDELSLFLLGMLGDSDDDDDDDFVNYWMLGGGGGGLSDSSSSDSFDEF